MRRSKEDSELTRVAILDAAERVFCERGYAQATVEAISRAAGLTRGAFYWHFRDKAEVLAALHGRSFLPQEQMLTALAESDSGDPLASILDMAIATLRSFEVDERAQGIFRIMSDLSTGEDGRDTLADLHGEMSMLIRRIMERARDNGTLHPDLTPREAEVFVTSIIGGLLGEWLRTGRGFPLASMGEKLLRRQTALMRAETPAREQHPPNRQPEGPPGRASPPNFA